MTSRWYVAPYDPALWRDEETTVPKPYSDLSIRFPDFVDNIWHQWPETEVSRPHSWQLRVNDVLGVSGSLLGEGNQILAIEPDIGFVEFLLWYRAFVSSRYDLFLFAEGQWESLRLISITTADEIVEFTGITD